MDRRCKNKWTIRMRRVRVRAIAVCIAFLFAEWSPAEEPEPDNRYLAFWLGGTRREKEELYRQASPMAFVTAAAPPMFFYHGEKDLLVLPHGPKALKQALDDVGVATQFVMVPDDGHIGAFMHADALAAAYVFLDSHLQPKTTAASGRRTCETVAGTH